MPASGVGITPALFLAGDQVTVGSDSHSARKGSTPSSSGSAPARRAAGGCGGRASATSPGAPAGGHGNNADPPLGVLHEGGRRPPGRQRADRAKRLYGWRCPSGDGSPRHQGEGQRRGPPPEVELFISLGDFLRDFLTPFPEFSPPRLPDSPDCPPPRRRLSSRRRGIPALCFRDTPRGKAEQTSQERTALDTLALRIAPLREEVHWWY